MINLDYLEKIALNSVEKELIGIKKQEETEQNIIENKYNKKNKIFLKHNPIPQNRLVKDLSLSTMLASPLIGAVVTSKLMPKGYITPKGIIAGIATTGLVGGLSGLSYRHFKKKDIDWENKHNIFMKDNYNNPIHNSVLKYEKKYKKLDPTGEVRLNMNWR